jgi:hypothetical protein
MNVKENIESMFLFYKVGALFLTRRSETLRRAKVTSKRSHVYSIRQSITQCTTLKGSNGGHECLFFYKHANPSDSFLGNPHIMKKENMNEKKNIAGLTSCEGGLTCIEAA